MSKAPRSILHLCLHNIGPADGELYDQVLALVRDVTPQVMALPPDAIAVDLTGALRFWDRDAAGIAALIRLRALALLGVETTAAAGPSRMVSAMAAAVTPPGETTVIGHDPAEIRAFLRPRATASLWGVGPTTARALSQYGLHTIGDVADTPLLTLQRILGGSVGRALHERAHGRDDRLVVPEPVAQSASASHRFARDELEPAQHRRALLELAGQLGSRLRSEAQAAKGIAIEIRYADRSTTSRSRTLAEATNHTVVLARSAYDLYETLGLQRARVRAISLKAEGLRAAELSSRQLTFDQGVDKALLVEAVADRARRRYGADVIKPAALAVTRRPARH
ncbi:DNA polymerase Y family protein [Streptomyces sp. NBC_01304]|uniref:DNA polymerase Y family protein n=1 Tax=Streptomyces sp. NBC_01304 TaxID=2903818 RepID=UPI002E14FCD5